MSSHRRRTKYFSRPRAAKDALFKGLMVSLVEHGRIKTTVDKAKELRRHIEKAVTLCKRGTLNARRLTVARLGSEVASESLFKEIAPRFESRPGGYTRIIKIGRRPGDTAEMAFIEWSDLDYTQFTKSKGDKKADSKEAKEELKKENALKSKAAKARAVTRKTVSRIQKDSRRASRAQA